MIRTIIKIDEKLCNGCGLCAAACQEGAIAMADGKARLVREDYCDGLGNCLPACLAGAISFEEREAPAFDGRAAARAGLAQIVKAQAEEARNSEAQAAHVCPGSTAKTLGRRPAPASPRSDPPQEESELVQWPVQIKLVPVEAPYFQNADLLVAADCSAYAFAGFHRRFMKNRVTLIGCPKLDGVDYAEKLTEILRRNDIRSVHVVRMEVPCCGGLEQAVRQALTGCGKLIPWRVTVLSADGRILEE